MDGHLTDSASARDHVFVSYAVEDFAFASWLARRLTASGYLVWMDRLKLRGGEPWMGDISVAIRERCARVLAVYSKTSVKKHNPQAEWLAALSQGQSSGVPDFLIPLNLDGTPPSQLPFNLMPISWIDFTRGWAQGLREVLDKLASVGVPRPLTDGPALAAESCLPHESRCVVDRPEVLASNLLRVTLPPAILRYESTRRLAAEDRKALELAWPVRPGSETTFHTLARLPAELETRFGLRIAGGCAWASVHELDGVRTFNIVRALIHKELDHLFREIGLRESAKHIWYFPETPAPTWVRFRDLSGTERKMLAVGRFTYRVGARRESLRHHLAFGVRVNRRGQDSSTLVIRAAVQLTDDTGQVLDGARVNSRRKRLCRSWYNEQWLKRTLAIAEHVFGRADVPPAVTPKSIRVHPGVLSFSVPFSLQDAPGALVPGEEELALLRPWDGDEPEGEMGEIEDLEGDP